MLPPCLLALATLVALATGARYADYADVKMPDYGGALDYDGPRDSRSDEYHEHLKDPPPPFEYKYDEERGKSGKRMRKVVESDDWQNTVQKPKNKLNSENPQISDTYSLDDLPANIKFNQKDPVHRARLKPKNLHGHDSMDIHDKHAVRYRGWNRNEDDSYIDRHDGTGDEFEGDKNNDFEDDQVKKNHIHRDATMKIARRKPRDRSNRAEPSANEEGPILSLRRRPAKDEFRPEEDMRFMRRPQYRLQSEESKAKGGLPQKKRDDYSEYYDMKRVRNIKDKLFEDRKMDQTTTMRLFRMRTSAEGQRSWQGAEADAVDGVEELRRLMNPAKHIPSNQNYDEEPDDNTMTTPNDPDYDEAIKGFPERRAMIQKTSSDAPTMISTTSAATTTAAMTTESTTNTTSNETNSGATETPEIEVEYVETTQSTTTEMSLAEKSRLSILKKAQRKEMLNKEATKKPLVLLQVTNALHTLVMVEPPTRLEPWQQVTVVHEDTSDNLMKVKRLMRKKLLSNAKDIHELAENWDDMICDYVDMSLLEKTNTSSINSVNMRLIFFYFFVIVLL